MATLIVTTREGEERELAAEVGLSVMEVIRDRGLDDLLDSSGHRAPGWRLSCQIPFGADLDDMRVTIAPED